MSHLCKRQVGSNKPTAISLQIFEFFFTPLLGGLFIFPLQYFPLSLIKNPLALRVVPLSEKNPLTLLNLGFPEYGALTCFGMFLGDYALRAKLLSNLSSDSGLWGFRSPLLSPSRLISIFFVTQMFQFTKFENLWFFGRLTRFSGRQSFEGDFSLINTSLFLWQDFSLGVDSKKIFISIKLLCTKFQRNLILLCNLLLCNLNKFQRNLLDQLNCFAI